MYFITILVIYIYFIYFNWVQFSMWYNSLNAIAIHSVSHSVISWYIIYVFRLFSIHFCIQFIMLLFRKKHNNLSFEKKEKELCHCLLMWLCHIVQIISISYKNIAGEIYEPLCSWSSLIKYSLDNPLDLFLLLSRETP